MKMRHNTVIFAIILVVGVVLLGVLMRRPSRSVLLFEAAGSGDLEKVKGLVKEGADINYKHKGEWGWTPLMSAIYHDQTNVALYLIEAGASVNVRDVNGQTALMKVAMYGDAQADIAEDLISHGADLTAKDSTGETALDYAKSAPPKPKIIDLLLRKPNPTSGGSSLMSQP